jgi:hypothetical protein
MKEKYDHIQKGDTVYRKKIVQLSYNIGKGFWMPFKVERTTKTMIILTDGTRWRKNGNIVDYGSCSIFRQLGEKADNWSTEIVKDQSNEYREAKQKVKVIREMKSRLDDVRNMTTTRLFQIDVQDIKKLIHSLEKLKANQNETRTI